MDQTTAIVAETFFSGWVISYSIPDTITTNQGRQFESNFFSHLANLLGIHNLSTTAFHPGSNVLVEHFHRQLKSSTKCHAAERWIKILLIILLDNRSSFKEDIQATIAKVVYGLSLRLPGEFFQDDELEIH